MASIAELIDFLMNLMRDDDARHEFDRDPDATLANRGLADVTGQDVRDARLLMADRGSAQPRADRPERGGSSGDGDAVREIHYTTTNFSVGDVTTTIVTVNDDDTVIVDSFNTDVTAIQDNDTTDVDVISIVDNTTDGDTTDGNAEISGDEEGSEGETGDRDQLDPVAGAGSGASEGFAPDTGDPPPDSEEGSDSELSGDIDPSDSFDGELDEGAGGEDGFTFETDPPAEESFDELVG